MTHTYAIVEVTPATYAEIEAKLRAAGYDHAFELSRYARDKHVIDMHGIALQRGKPERPSRRDDDVHEEGPLLSTGEYDD